ncbi:MAG: hypothetical protein B6D71_08860 [gamma proteobacterium symbiont of Stewartia floridana]|nr:MAG: hypothetical protein B6D71_08860 [gamma proteobacterium symbiont of Stewartia floridana]
MKKILSAVTILIISLFTTSILAGSEKQENIKPNIVGKTFLYDYGDYAYEITITSDESLHWKLVKGSFEGPDAGNNPYLASQIGNGIIFLSWKEESGYQFYNLMNLNSGKLTTHANASGMSINMGTVSVKK